ncbi:sulfatase-like hydrolase/transferase [Halobacterium noricense]|uniref:sulfatase-like hydrolase/transferase n=1 Tax=Halobacterium noricense TaxID=223182 RepID=UPI001E518B1E|nr:sulfatase-like hydrolase/transferase [Halobacterium noricense]UHH26529.1 sulfatase-like hydrolase/transferase [Halobacterium noricense]
MQTVLVTVDSLRADHLAHYGYERDTMPVLNTLSDSGTVFENAFSNGSYTRISIPAIMTSNHLAYDAIDEFPTIASVLSAEDILTAVVGTQIGIDLINGGYRFDETIDLGRDKFYDEANNDRPPLEELKYQINRPATRISQFLQQQGLEPIYNLLQKPYNVFFDESGFQYLGYTSAEKVTDRATTWIESNAEDDFFLWVHYMEAHRPYGVHDDDPKYLDSPVDEDEIKRLMKRAGVNPGKVSEEEWGLLRDLYDSDLRYCSRHIERLFNSIKDMGIWKDLNIFFSSDHGEEFYEHGGSFHRNYPYDELMHVPLLAKSPVLDAPDRVTEMRELLDIAPTIHSIHLPDEDRDEFMGTPLDEDADRHVFALGQPGDSAPAVAYRTEEWKLIWGEDRQQLYDLESDPREQNNLIEADPDMASKLREEIPHSLKTREVKPPREPESDVDRERLEALGYLEQRE